MPRAEVGSIKHLSNKMKSKGLQRLRWYCQPCEKQCRDANGFKCHVNSESHVRQLQIVGEDPRKYIEQYSREFHSDFINLLRRTHGEKFISANRFYNEYIANKEHVHMNATKWQSLTEYVKYLGREGICNVKEDEKDGLCIAWRDLSPEAVRRQQEKKAAEQREARTGVGEDKMMKQMAARAKADAEAARLRAEKAAAARAAETKVATESKSATPEDDPVVTKERKESVNPGSQNPQSEAPKAEAAPVKIGFTLKAKTQPGTSGPAKQNVFKRMRAEEKAAGNSTKRLKL